MNKKKVGRGAAHVQACRISLGAAEIKISGELLVSKRINRIGDLPISRQKIPDLMVDPLPHRSFPRRSENTVEDPPSGSHVSTQNFNR